MSTVYTPLQQPVLASLTITVMDDDAFFNPTGLQFSGFAYDGFLYSNGVRVSPAQTASWYAEGPGAARGALATFPTVAVAVVSGGSLTILDATSGSLVPWMVFYYGDTFAFPNNFQGVVESFSPASASWGAGMLTVSMTADPGSPVFPVAALTIDFSRDQVYIDYSQ